MKVFRGLPLVLSLITINILVHRAVPLDTIDYRRDEMKSVASIRDTVGANCWQVKERPLKRGWSRLQAGVNHPKTVMESNR